MGHYFNPTPPIVSRTGAQPYAGDKTPPSITAVPVNNPPPVSEGRGANQQAIIVAAWQPDPWVYYYNDSPLSGQPYGSGKLPPAIDAVPVNNPPFVHRGRSPLPNILQLWQPPDPLPLVSNTGQQPLAPGKLPPSITAVPVNTPPFLNEGRSPWLVNVLQSWQPPDPQLVLQNKKYIQSVDQPPFAWQMIPTWGTRGGLPQTTKFLPQGAAAAAAVRVVYAPAWLPSIIQSWQPPDPLPTLPRNLSPGIPGQSVDNPPPVNEGEFTNAGPNAILMAWQPPPPSPILPGKLSPGIPGQSVDNPPPVNEGEFANAGPNAILTAWQPLAPPPIQANKLSPAIPGQSVDNPPSFRPFTPYPVIPDLLPILPRLLSPGIPGQSVDNPPQFRAQQPYQPLDTPYPQITVKQIQPFVAASVRQVFTSIWLNPVLASWQPQDPQPTLPRNLNPSITAVPVNNPPFVLYGNETWLSTILTSWQPPDPPPVQKGPLNPSLTGVSADNPPFAWQMIPTWGPRTDTPQPRKFVVQPGAAAAAVQGAFTQTWLVNVLQSWQPLDLQPTLPRNLTPASVDNPPFGLLVTVVEPWIGDTPAQQPSYKITTGVAVNNPPFSYVGRNAITAELIQSWQFPDPPIQRGPFFPQGAKVDNPPFSSPGRSGITANLIQSWQPPDPPPVQKGPLNPQLTAVRVDNPPGVNLENTSTYWAIIGTWEIPLPPQPQQTKYIVTIIPPPAPSTELHDHPFFATFGKMTVH